MNKKIMYTFIPAIAALGILVGFKSSSNKVVNNIEVTNNVNKVFNVSNCHFKDDHGEHEGWTPITMAYFASGESKLTLSDGSYYLDGDINLADQQFSGFSVHSFIINGNVNFCLNGHVIKGSTYSDRNTNIFSINENCKLNLYDCNGSHHKYDFVAKDETNPDDNYWFPSDTETSLSLDGGYLYCNGGLAVGCKGEFNMYGGSIVGFSHGGHSATTYGQASTIISTPSSCDTATINIKNGNIAGCNVNDSIISVGTYSTTKSKINMTGGVIKNSYARNAIIYNNTEFNMTGGKIHNCYTGNVKGTSADIKDNAVIFNPEDANSKTKIAGNAEITDNITLMKEGMGGCLVCYKDTTTIKLGGTAKIIRNRASTDEQSGTYAERIKTTELYNVVCRYQTGGKSFNSKIYPLTTEDSLEKGAKFGIRAIQKNRIETSGYVFTIGVIDSAIKQFFLADSSQLIVKEVSQGSNHLQLAAIDPISPQGQIKNKSVTSSGKPTIDNAILISGKLDKSIEVVIKDKDDLGEIKEKVEENIKKDLTPNSHLISQFDIRLESDGVEIENIDGNKYGITLKLPDTYSALSKQKVIYIKDDGSIDMKDTTVTGNKCYFETTHFSTWGFAAEGELVPGGKVSGSGAVAGIVIGSIVGTGSIGFVVYIIVFKKRLRFAINGYIVCEEELKWRDEIDFNNDKVAGKKWFSDKQLTKPFTKTHMGLFNKTLYSNDMNGDYKDGAIRVDANHISLHKLLASAKRKVMPLVKKITKVISKKKNNNNNNSNNIPEESNKPTSSEEQNNNNEIKED